MIRWIISGRLLNHRIKVMTGDRVQVEMTPYDLTKGRIVYRSKSLSSVTLGLTRCGARKLDGYRAANDAVHSPAHFNGRFLHCSLCARLYKRHQYTRLIAPLTFSQAPRSAAPFGGSMKYRQ